MRYLPLLLLLGACEPPFVPLEDHPCPPGGTQLTYEGFGAPFLNSYCQGCHSTGAQDRRGAPGEFLFDTRAQVQAQRARIFVRSAGANDSMPPGPQDPPRRERDQLAEWLACGAP